jgi:DNA-binding transcriptional LysR family regulator
VKPITANSPTGGRWEAFLPQVPTAAGRRSAAGNFSPSALNQSLLIFDEVLQDERATCLDQSATLGNLANLDRGESQPPSQCRRHVQLVVTDNQPAAENSQRGVASERHWLINDLSAKYDFLRAGLGWGHMPLGLVAKDLMAGSLVEIKRRAWQVRPLMFVMSRRRGHELSTCEAQLVKLLEAEGD